MREVFSSWPSFTPTTGMGRRFIRLQQDGVDRAPTATASSKTLERRRWQLKQEGRRRTPWTHGRGLVRDDDPYAWCDGKRLEDGGGGGEQLKAVERWPGSPIAAVDDDIPTTALLRRSFSAWCGATARGLGLDSSAAAQLTAPLSAGSAYLVKLLGCVMPETGMGEWLV